MERRTAKARPERGRLVGALVAAAALGLALAGPAAGEAGAVEEARAEAERTLERVVEVLQAEGLTPAERRRRVEAIARERFDFRTIARLVVGRPWRRFSDEQRERFVGDFESLLSASYGRRIGRYDGSGVRVAGARSEPRGDVTVRTRIEGGEANGVRVDYRLRRGEDGDWRVIDVVIEGVSLVSSYRSQFAPIVSRGGPEALLRRLSEKVGEAAEGDATPPGVSEAS